PGETRPAPVFVPQEAMVASQPKSAARVLGYLVEVVRFAILGWNPALESHATARSFTAVERSLGDYPEPPRVIPEQLPDLIDIEARPCTVCAHGRGFWIEPGDATGRGADPHGAVRSAHNSAHRRARETVLGGPHARTEAIGRQPL